VRLAATITVGDDEIDVTGYVWTEENERGRGTAVLLDEPHDLAEYRNDAEHALADAYGRAVEEAASC
jgi:hypothetical protein